MAALPFDNILIYEDDLAQSRRFLPLTYTRPVAALRSGSFTGIERVQRLLPGVRLFLHTRPELQAVTAQRYGLPVNQAPTGKTLLLNARAAFTWDGSDQDDLHESLSEDVRTKIESGQPLMQETTSRTSLPITALWDIIHQNAKTIEADVSYLPKEIGKLSESAFHGVLIEGDVFAHPSAKIGLGVVLDATDGPIIIDEAARIMPSATIMGPAVIGKGSLVKAAAKIYEGTSIGPVCKVGGEIENAIFQGYSNKQHDGYVGHSYLGEWCNLGADTNTSDLKNDYSKVRVMVEEEEFNTESMFVGLLMGDHSKSAINTQFNTGTAVGVSCNVFDSGFPPKWIPNFSWGGAAGFTGYRFEKAIAVAKIVTSRRNVELTAEEESMLRKLFEKQNQMEA